MDFGLLPPEINSGRMYTGPGAGSMLGAATAWDNLARELHASAASYSSALADLTAGWQGPSSMAMAAAAMPYVTWTTATAIQAEQTANQARVAATAYETAFVATVPPAVVAANRSLLLTLIATNIFGQNTAAIAATEADYAEMWAQDASAMYGYAGSSAAAGQLTPFQPAPQTTSPAGTVGQAATVAHATGSAAGAQATAALPQTLQSLAAAPAATAVGTAADPPLFTPAEIFLTVLTSFLNATIGPLSPVKLYDPFGAFYDLALQTFLAPFNNFNMQMAYGAALGRVASAPAGIAATTSAAPVVSAAVGDAGLAGSLSVPPSWTGAAPALSSFTTAMPQAGLAGVPAAVAADGQGSVFSNMALSGLAGRAVAGGARGAGSTIGGGAGMIAAETAAVTIIVIPED